MTGMSLAGILHGTRTRVVRLQHGVLRRVIGLGGLYSIGYGDVGSSVYYALGVTALWALGAAPIAVAIGGVFFICTVLTYAELATAIPEAGGSCSYTRRALGDAAGFIAGWALLLDYIITIAISAFIIGPYLGYFIPMLKTPEVNTIFTIGIIVFLAALNIVGIKESAGMSLVLALLSLLTQTTLLIIGGVMLLNLPHLISQVHLGVSPTWPHFIYGITVSMVGYTGVGAIAQMAGETQNPEKKIPQALLLTMVTVIVMSLGITAVALSAMPASELGSTWLENPVAGIAAHLPVIGRYMSPWIAIVAATVLFLATNAGVIGASRLTYAMGSYLLLPSFFHKLHPQFGTPYLSLLIFPTIAGVIVFLAKDISHLADLYNFGAMLSYAFTHLALIILRVKEPTMGRPFRLRGTVQIMGGQIPLTAIIGLLGTFAVWVVVVITHPYGRLLGFIWMGIGIVMYAGYRLTTHMPMLEPMVIETVEVPGFHKLEVRNILVPILATTPSDLLEMACKLARQDKTQVTALYVIEVPMTLPLSAPLPKETAASQRALDRAQAIAQEYGVPIETRVIQARLAGRLIVETAKDLKADLILLEAGRRKQLGEILFGRTVDYVLRNASCRVLVSDLPVEPVAGRTP